MCQTAPLVARVASLARALGLVGTLSLPPCAWGDTWHVPANATTIHAGLTLASPGDTVLIACGSYFERNLVMPSGVTLRSASGQPGCVTIDGQLLGGRLLDCVASASGTRIEGITFTGGLAPSGGENFTSFGGAIRCDNSVLSITDCDFVQNQARFGAGVGARSSSPILKRCNFMNNAAADSSWAAGGGMYSSVSAPVLQDCSFTGNSALSVVLPGDGGGLFCETSLARITGCTFDQNNTGVGGGALYSFNGDRSSLANCTFTNNRADAGGAVYVENSQPTFQDCTYSANTGENGGAVFMGSGSSASFQDCAFDLNSSLPFSGGAVQIWLSSSEFLRCRFTANSTSLHGGAVSINWSTGHKFTDCVFENNTAERDGGAIRLTGISDADVQTCNLVGNGALGRGGGIFCDEGSTVTVDRSLVVFGTAGAAVQCVLPGSVLASCSNIFGNVGGDWVECVAGQLAWNGNLSQDPLFCDLMAGQYSLSLPASPCLPQNNTCGKQIGPLGEGCGCPPDATILVPGDHPTIAAALAAAFPGDIVGVCDGVYSEPIDLVSGVHLVGASRELCRVEWSPAGSPAAVLLARQISDSTVVQGFTFDGLDMAPQVVLVDSASTGVFLRNSSVTGGTTCNVRNRADSRIQFGGALSWSNEMLADGALAILNENTSADSLDASFNWWGSTDPAEIQARMEGPVRICPVALSPSAADADCPPPMPPVHTPLASLNNDRLSLSLRPNPFSEATRVDLALPHAAWTTLEIYDIRGRLVRSLHAGKLEAGAHVLQWNGRDQHGAAGSPGIYFLRLEADDVVQTRKMLLLR